MAEMIKVGMADLNVCKRPDSITTIGLGSCVGIVLYDNVTGICGLAHIMLPDSTKISNNSNIAKFADTALDELLKRLVSMGVSRFNLKAKIAGGAQMFTIANAKSDLLSVGARNTEAVKNKLSELGIPLVASDTGENYGRTIEFIAGQDKLLVKAVGKPEKYI